MAETYNIFLDESCHLEHDGIPVMTLGVTWCPTEKTKDISRRIRDIKEQFGLSTTFETKWTKVSPAKYDFYRDLIDYFLDDDDLHFRAVVIPDKKILDHKKYGQTHDDWYYKMCFTLLEPIIDPTQHYNIYMDIKDTRSESKRANLEKILRKASLDGSGNIVRRVQQIRSHESEVMQLADLLIGAVTYANRGQSTSDAKIKLVQRIRTRTNHSLVRSTWLREPKLNIFVWRPEK
ncbi:hypothetical protein CA11_13860 [Gimesia maris]|uniref:DUF3800 domain-containing protein n=1 Tax=Gimesia maris TaxID=122 RepID=UPI00118AB36A|nr:DUF3800 domain-containing protein [Gimesia maris]QDU13602.1 hypothetical protein CA11_13860 [Gimesia maris]